MENKTKHAGGRPRKIIDLKQVAKLAKICCTVEEIANILDLSKSTLDHNEEFLQVYKKNIDNGKMSLRRAQMELALKGNATMQIWLGKQYLGQKDKQEIEHSGEIDQTVIILPANSRMNNTEDD